ncbi:HLH-domain-containing protein [Hypoxylon rubiginosum]|uniref:HLH-domain-containing protein n=1 Tax=Hypoxylon rubiginosum TaxID=110542 RepID=A0ACB9YQC4_9PEZI|nr:HLH-domain-containing protein [Hypoxylon rubiginosum]
MDAGVMQDIDVYPAGNDKTFETFFDQSTDYSQQLSSISFWDELDRSAESSVVNSATSVSHQTPSTSANSPASTTSHNLSNNSHKHKLTGREVPKKRQCSDIRRSKFTEDPSTLDCSDYWLRFDSDNESDPIFTDNRESKPRNLAQPHPRSRVVGRPGNSFKVAYPPSSTADLIDDSALDHALSDDDDLFSMALADQLTKTESLPIPSEVPPRERLYSTPLSWETPQPGFRMDYVNVNPPFNDPERQRLLAIAMGTGQAPQQQQPNSRQVPNMDFRFEINQSPTTMSDSKSNTPEPRTKPAATRPQAPSRSNSTEAMDKLKEKPRNSDRAAHNDIERKYRTNLKDKIAELRDAIPSLRAIPEDGDDNENPASRTAPKVSKGTVLTKATEYIHQLERRNRSMAQKNEELARRLHAFEQLVGAAPAPNWAPQGYGASVFNPRAFS